MENSTIIEKVLMHLQGYVLESSIDDDGLTDLDYDKKITEEEIINYYETATDYATSYIQKKLPSESIVDTAICMWTAGLIWNKYDIRVNNQEDETNTLGFGDKLVIQAKEMLKPFKYYKMMVY